MSDIRLPSPGEVDWSSVPRVFLDVVGASAIVIILVLALAKLTIIGGRSALVIGCGCVRFFSRLYQAALGLVFVSAIVIAVYFYFTTEDTRDVLHEHASSAVPLVSQVVAHVHGGARHALQSDVVAQGARHIKYIAERVLENAGKQ